ncbi:MAG: DUF5723 family protein [Bacteroidia bacterium]
MYRIKRQITFKPFLLKEITRVVSVFVFLFIQYNSFAQQDLTLYNMEAVPQRIYDNPAFRPTDSTIFIGLPLISSQYFNFSNSGFKYSDLMVQDGDSVKPNVSNMISKLTKENYISIDYHTDIISFGFPIQKNYFSFNITEKVDIRLGYSQDFLNFIWKGNGDPSIIGQTVNLAPSLDAIHYREYGAGWSRKITDKLTVGGKLKYLYGEENISTNNTNASIYTDPNDYSLTAQSNINVNTSGIDNDEFKFNSAHDVVDYLLKKPNNGAAIDLGATYKFNDKITFSASLTDLGFITWNDAVTSYESNDPNATFTYQGINLNQFLNNNSVNLGNTFQNTLDSAKNIFKIDSLHHRYTTMVAAQIYLGANYKLIAGGNAGILLYGQVFDNTINPAVALSYNQKVGRWFTASVSYSIYDRSYDNIGVGLALNGGPVQWYIATDNVLAPLAPQDAKIFHLNFGINISWAHKKKVKAAQY